MLEELKKRVYEANMKLPQYGWLRLPGEMSVRSTGRPDVLLSNQAAFHMRI